MTEAQRMSGFAKLHVEAEMFASYLLISAVAVQLVLLMGKLVGTDCRKGNGDRQQHRNAVPGKLGHG